VRRFRLTSAAFLLALLGAAAVLPIAAMGGARKGCLCTVRMACCEDGTCAMPGSAPEPPASGPEWRTCRREAPAAQAAPLDAFERALKKDFLEERRRETSARISEILAAPMRPEAPSPATPPPRLFTF
jgi:hypothetical protein